MKAIDRANYIDCLAEAQCDYQRNYFAMYSSILDGIATDPALMLVPVDDHLVHRGDGIFEALKCVGGNLYNMGAHLQRLERSAAALYHQLPWSRSTIAQHVIDTTRAGGQADCVIRILVSRGPGSFSANPYDCPQPGLYIIATASPTPFMEAHPEGARIIVSRVPLKPPPLNTAKSCNYILNALMKKEAADARADFPSSFDENGCLAEGATESIGVVTESGELLFPQLRRILRGTTMIRVMERAQSLVETGELQRVAAGSILRKTMEKAAEIIIIGTTIDLVAAREFDGKPVGNGKPGPVYRKLHALLLDDMHNNRDVLTPALR